MDILVNNVWGGYEFYNDGTEFWNEQGFWTAPISRWDKSFKAGARAHYVASCLAAPLMLTQQSMKHNAFDLPGSCELPGRFGAWMGKALDLA